MPVNGFSVGRDVSLNINTPVGIQRFSLISGFDAKPEVSTQKVKGLDGLVRNVIFHDGWTGSLDIERQDSTLDDYWAQIEADYFAGFNSGAATITETITEVDGSVSQFRFEGVVLKLDDAGNWKGDSTVKQKLSFMASRRIKVA